MDQTTGAGHRFALTSATRGSTDSHCIEIAGEEKDIRALEELFRFLNRHVLLNSKLDECFALEFHKWVTPEGELLHTKIGQLVFTAKPYGPTAAPGNVKRADQLAQHMANFILRHPSYRRADVLLAVPSSDPEKPFHLPDHLVSKVVAQTGQKAAPRGAVWKTRTTPQMKRVRSTEEKLSIIRGTIAVDASQFSGKTIIVIDDIFETGASMNEVARVLKAARAETILGLVGTKTLRDLQ